MAHKILSTAVPYKNLLEKYVRPENQRPNLSQFSEFEDVPVIDIGAKDRARVVNEVHNACTNFGFFQVTNHGMSKDIVEEIQKVAHEFFKLPVEEKMKLYSDDPSKTMRLSTSFNVNKEEVHNWRDYLRLHCRPLEEYVPEWPSNPPSFKAEGEILSHAIQEHCCRGKVLETKGRHDEGKEIERSLLKLHQVLLDMSVMVEAQGEQMDNIEHHVVNVSHYVQDGNKNFKEAKDYQRSSWKCMCFGIIALLLIILVIVLPIIASFSHS